MESFKLCSIVCLLASPAGYAATYDFESDAVGSVPKDTKTTVGKVHVVKHKDIGLCVRLDGSRTVAVDLTKIPKLKDYSVSWRQVYDKPSRSGVLLRSKLQMGAKHKGIGEGYLVQVNPVTNDVRIYTMYPSVYKMIKSAKLSASGVGAVSYYQASIVKDTITLKYSSDGKSYKKVLEVKDDTYKDAGLTQLTEGWGRSVGHVYYDDISFEVIKGGQVTQETGGGKKQEVKPVVMSKHQLKFDEIFKRRVVAKDATALALLAKQKKAGSKLTISNTGMAELIEQWQVAEAMKDVK